MGSCKTQCQDSYAFAVLQDKMCWCSDYIPTEQTSTGRCNEQCPGYPSDECGNVQEGLFGYLSLDQAPSGTAGAASSTQAATSTYDQPVSSFSNPDPHYHPWPWTSEDYTSTSTSTFTSALSSSSPTIVISSRTSELTKTSLQSTYQPPPSSSSAPDPSTATAYVSQTVTQTVTQKQTQKPNTVVSYVTLV